MPSRYVMGLRQLYFLVGGLLESGSSTSPRTCGYHTGFSLGVEAGSCCTARERGIFNGGESVSSTTKIGLWRCYALNRLFTITNRVTSLRQRGRESPRSPLTYLPSAAGSFSRSVARPATQPPTAHRGHRRRLHHLLQPLAAGWLWKALNWLAQLITSSCLHGGLSTWAKEGGQHAHGCPGPGSCSAFLSLIDA
jgi:hypothetical protein